MNYCYARASAHVPANTVWVAPGFNRDQKTQEPQPPDAFEPHSFYGAKTKYSVVKENFILFETVGSAPNLKYFPQNHAWQAILDIDQKNNFLAQCNITTLLNDAFHDGEFPFVDSALNSLDIEKASPGLLVSILSSTIPARNHLYNRPSFFARVETSLSKRGKLAPGLLDGLK